jgi:hypothetical protein
MRSSCSSKAPNYLCEALGQELVVLLGELARFYAQQLLEKNHYHQSVDSTAIAASSAQHLTIIFLIDNHGSASSRQHLANAAIAASRVAVRHRSTRLTSGLPMRA